MAPEDGFPAKTAGDKGGNAEYADPGMSGPPPIDDPPRAEKSAGMTLVGAQNDSYESGEDSGASDVTEGETPEQTEERLRKEAEAAGSGAGGGSTDPYEGKTKEELKTLAGDLEVTREDGRTDLEPTVDDYLRALRERDAAGSGS